MPRNPWSANRKLSAFGSALGGLGAVLLIFAFLLMASGCFQTLPVTPTIPPLPPSIKAPPIPFPSPPGIRP